MTLTNSYDSTPAAGGQTALPSSAYRGRTFYFRLASWGAYGGLAAGVLSLSAGLLSLGGANGALSGPAEWFAVGLSLILLGAGMLSLWRGRRRLAAGLCAPVVLYIAGTLAWRLSASIAGSNEISWWGRFLEPSTNSIVALSLCVFVLLTQAVPGRRDVRSPALSLVGIVVIGLGGAALFGHATAVRVAYAWSQIGAMTVLGALGFIFLGLGLAAIAWERYRAVQRSTRELWRSMTTYFTASALVITVMTALFVALPFHQHIQAEIENQLVRLTESKTQTLEQFFLLVREIAAQSSLTLDRALEPGAPEAANEVEFSDYVQGAARFTAGGKLAFAQGPTLETLAPGQCGGTPGRASVLGLQPIEGRYFLMVAVPRAADRAAGRPSCDLFAFSAAPMKRVLRRDTEDSPISEIYFGRLGNHSEIFTFDAKQDRFSVPFIHLHPHLRETVEQLDGDDTGAQVVNPARSSRVMVHAAIPNSPFFILASANSADVHIPPLLRLLEFSSWGIVLSLLVAAGSFFVVRELIVEIERSQRIARAATRLKEAVFGAAPDAVITCFSDGTLQSLNRSAARLFQLDPLKPPGEVHISDLLVMGDGSDVINQLLMRTSEDLPFSFECTGKASGGPSIPLDCSVSNLSLGKDSLHIIFARDISQRRDAETKIKRSLEEKDLLLREIHHRVKNNLQIISSLLKLQSTSVKGVEAAEALNESHARIKSIALIHEHLYQSQSLAAINFGAYLKRLCREIAASQSSKNSIELNVDAEDAPLALDQAIPCGLLVTELVTNSLKHAFPNGGGGAVTVHFRRDRSGQATLIVEDTGIGFDIDDALAGRRSLGLKLIERLTDQLGGRASRPQRSKGAAFQITFGGDHHGQSTAAHA